MKSSNLYRLWIINEILITFIGVNFLHILYLKINYTFNETIGMYIAIFYLSLLSRQHLSLSRSGVRPTGEYRMFLCHKKLQETVNSCFMVVGDLVLTERNDTFSETSRYYHIMKIESDRILKIHKYISGS